MHPILFDFGSFTIYSYGVLLAAAYLLGLQFALMRARARGLDGQRVMDLGIWIIVSALIGAKLLLLIVDFVDVYWGEAHFWAFNIADAAITTGAVLVLLEMVGVGRHHHHASRPV